MEKFDISSLGFLPNACVSILPNKFEFLQETIDNLSVTKSGNTFRKYVYILPTYDPLQHSTKDLTLEEKKYMYSILCMIMNRYVWCTGVLDAENYDTIPQIIGIPLYEISTDLGIAMSLTHASVDLWNWKIPTGQNFSLDCLEIINTMTGDKSEEWFYKVMIAIEGIGGTMLNEIYEISSAHKNSNRIDKVKLKNFLLQLSDNIAQSIKIIKRMNEHCDPTFFFNTLRIFLSGSKNDNLPNGIKIDLSPIEKETITLNYAGGSAAQSTLIQVYDKLLGIDHAESNKFLTEMRMYMPQAHRKYLHEITSIRELCESSDCEIQNAFNDCIDKLGAFRQAHLSLIHNYIMKFVPKTQLNTNNDNNQNNAHGEKGTGGTDPVTFCSDIIRETNKTKVLSTSLKSSNNDITGIPIYVFIVGVILLWFWLWR